MKKVLVTDAVASIISRLQTEEGLNEQKAFLSDAMSAATKQYEQLECYDPESFLPLTAISMYHELIDELSKSRNPKMKWL